MHQWDELENLCKSCTKCGLCQTRTNVVFGVGPKDADILFITDGDCYVSDSFTRRYKQIKEEKDFKTLGVLVNMGRSHCSDASLKEFCDSITMVSSIADLKDEESDINKSIFGAL